MTRCSNSICQYGFSHEPFDESNAKLVKSKWRETGATKIIYLLRGSFPRLCTKYEVGDCANKNSRKLHICGDSLFHICKSNYCSLSHSVTDEHNRNVFKIYNLDGLLKMTFVLPNILVPKRLVNNVETGGSAYTNLRKPSQSAVRKLQSKCNASLVLEAEGIPEVFHTASNESIVSDDSCSDAQSKLRTRKKDFNFVHISGKDNSNSNERGNNNEMIIKHLEKRLSLELSANNRLPAGVVFSNSISSLSNKLTRPEHIKSKTTSDSYFNTANTINGLNIIGKTTEDTKETVNLHYKGYHDLLTQRQNMPIKATSEKAEVTSVKGMICDFRKITGKFENHVRFDVNVSGAL